GHFLVMPSVLLALGVVFYAGLWLQGQDIDGARAAGLLPAPIAPPALPEYIGLLPQVQWDILLSQWAGILAIVPVAIVGVALVSAGIELDTETDADFDVELRASGLGCILTAALGGMAGEISLSRTVLAFKAGARSRLAPLWTSGLCLVTALFFGPALGYLP